MSKLPMYKDANTYNTGGYVVTNEEPELARDLLANTGRTFKLGGGICSGGEIAFMAMMPFCEKTVLVDHGYNACAAAYYKAALLSVMGAKRLRDLIVGGREFEFVLKATKALERIKAELPKFPPNVTALPKGTQDAAACLNFTTLTNMRKEWFYTPLSVLRETQRRLDTLTIVHGDLADLKEHGQFDLLYISNAFGHSGRNGTPTLAKTIQPLMQEGGLVLTTALPSGALPQHWVEVARHNPLRTGWPHVLLQYKG